jgi:ketosteroid isomerase-like protein
VAARCRLTAGLERRARGNHRDPTAGRVDVRGLSGGRQVFAQPSVGDAARIELSHRRLHPTVQVVVGVVVRQSEQVEPGSFELVDDPRRGTEREQLVDRVPLEVVHEVLEVDDTRVGACDSFDERFEAIVCVFRETTSHYRIPGGGQAELGHHRNDVTWRIGDDKATGAPARDHGQGVTLTTDNGAEPTDDRFIIVSPRYYCMPDKRQAGVDRIERYLMALEDADYAEAAAQFTEDVEYCHPLREEPIIGRAALRRFFAEERASKEGADALLHEIQNTVVEGSKYAVQGAVSGGGRESLFVAYFEVEGGRIAYYVPAPNQPIW